MPEDFRDGVPFTFFCSLLREIAKIPPRAWTHKRTSGAHPAIGVFERWVKSLYQKFTPLPPHTVAICLRLLFPEEDVRRKYEIQEARLAKDLIHSLGLQRDALGDWTYEGSVGCLGEEVRKVLESTCPHSGDFISPVSIVCIDRLLNELASASKFSHSSIRDSYSGSLRRPRTEIISSLFRKLSPTDAGFLTQIILKDLRPILYPVSELHYTAALKNFRSNAVYVLTKEDVMRIWDPTGWMLKYYHVTCNMETVADAFELPIHERPSVLPAIGMQVELPKAKKAHNSLHALQFLQASQKVWAETKYDGERAQIHVDAIPNVSPEITIFSKSKRDSTWERRAVHHIILETLGLAPGGLPVQNSNTVVRNVILDAELVAFKGLKVDEFWKIRKLIEWTAYDVEGSAQPVKKRVSSDIEVPESNRLGLVFYDVLMLNSTSLLQTPYSHRRALLESLIKVIPGKAILSARYPINMAAFQPSNELSEIFAQHIADHEEGLMLKAEESRYIDYKLPWVKFKKDYIDGYGDCIDLAIIGAGWEKERGRELRVPPSTYTTFYIGALTNAKERLQNPDILPHFFVYFTVSYGLSREQLEEVNFLIKSSEPVAYHTSMEWQTSYTITVFKGLTPPPRVVLRVPLLAELFGAGFTKSRNCEHYELRFPRIKKIHRPEERTWKDAPSLHELNAIAMKSVGVKNPVHDIDEWAEDLFGKSTTIGTDETRERKAEAEKKLFRLDTLAAKKMGILLYPQRKTIPTGLSFDGSSMLKTPQRNNIAPAISKRAIAPISTRCKSLSGSTSSRKMSFLNGKHVSFVGYSAKCLHCKELKRGVNVTRMVQCVETLLSGCGWNAETDVMAGWTRGGVVVVGNHDSEGEDMKVYISERLQKAWQGVGEKVSSSKIWVVGCHGHECIAIE